jgi:hypothetical protein
MNSKSTKRLLELEDENKRLQKENSSLLDRCATLEIDLKERIIALENPPQPHTTPPNQNKALTWEHIYR